MGCVCRGPLSNLKGNKKMWLVIIGLIIVILLYTVFGLAFIFASFTAYMGYIGVSELGATSEFVKLFCGMIGLFIGLAMWKFVRKMLLECLSKE